MHRNIFVSCAAASNRLQGRFWWRYRDTLSIAAFGSVIPTAMTLFVGPRRQAACLCVYVWLRHTETLSQGVLYTPSGSGVCAAFYSVCSGPRSPVYSQYIPIVLLTGLCNLCLLNAFKLYVKRAVYLIGGLGSIPADMVPTQNVKSDTSTLATFQT